MSGGLIGITREELVGLQVEAYRRGAADVLQSRTKIAVSLEHAKRLLGKDALTLKHLAVTGVLQATVDRSGAVDRWTFGLPSIHRYLTDGGITIIDHVPANPDVEHLQVAS